jgi:hypothetical protein
MTLRRILLTYPVDPATLSGVPHGFNQPTAGSTDHLSLGACDVIVIEQEDGTEYMIDVHGTKLN